MKKKNKMFLNKILKKKSNEINLCPLFKNNKSI